MENDISDSKFQGSDKNYSGQSDDDKKHYSHFIQVKYISDLDEYIQALNDGRTRFTKRQVIEWVEGLRIFSDVVLQAGWKVLIQGLRPHYVPSITEAQGIFKNVVLKANTDAHRKIRAAEQNKNLGGGTGLSRLMKICMSFSKTGEAGFHKKCIEFYNDMATGTKDRKLKVSFKDAIREHTKLLKKCDEDEKEVDLLVNGYDGDDRDELVDKHFPDTRGKSPI